MLTSIKCANSSRNRGPVVPHRMGFLHLVLSLAVESLLDAFNRIMQQTLLLIGKGSKTLPCKMECFSFDVFHSIAARS